MFKVSREERFGSACKGLYFPSLLPAALRRSGSHIPGNKQLYFEPFTVAAMTRLCYTEGHPRCLVPLYHCSPGLHNFLVFPNLNSWCVKLDDILKEPHDGGL